MAREPRPALALAVAIVTVTLGGCGGKATQSSGSAHARLTASSPRAASTKPQFVARAEGICRTLSAQEAPLRARQEALRGLPSASADSVFVSLARHVVALSRAADSKLQALPRPAGENQAIEQLVSNFSQDATDVTAIAAAAGRQESGPGEAAANALRHSIARVSSLASQYGMEDCFGPR